MSHTLVVGAAPAAGGGGFYARLLASAGHVVAADGAGEWCVSLGRVPDVVVGDFDSALEGARDRLRAAGAEIVEHSRDKDETDLRLAVEVALDRFGAPLCLTAAFSDRIDHTLAALGQLISAGEDPIAREPDWTGILCRAGEPIEIAMSEGQTFSVLALTPAEGVTVSGARWPLHQVTLPPLSGWGVSNTALGGLVRVTVRCGHVLMIIVDPAD